MGDVRVLGKEEVSRGVAVRAEALYRSEMQRGAKPEPGFGGRFRLMNLTHLILGHLSRPVPYVLSN